MSKRVLNIQKNEVSFWASSNENFLYFWNLFLHRNWENETFKIFDRFLDTEHCLYTHKTPGDSSSSLIPTRSDKNFYEIIGITIDEFGSRHALKEVNFIKMDIEGGEYFVVSAIYEYLNTYRPTLYLSIHPAFLMKKTHLYNPTKLTQQLVQHLSFYKYIYNVKGKLVDQSTVLKANDFDAFVFTDEPW
jgi:hypothetical protein